MKNNMELEIIRCKNCEHSREYPNNPLICAYWTDQWDMPTEPDAFCSCAKLKENCKSEKYSSVKPIKYRAKLKSNSEITVEGYYFEMRETTYCFTSDYERYPVPTHYYLICDMMTDWGLPNKAKMFEIDIDTLEEIYEEK